MTTKFVSKGSNGTASKTAFFTICSKNFLAHARALHESVCNYYTNAAFYVALCDNVDGMFDPSLEPFDFIYIEDLEMSGFDDMSHRYNITELNTAIKPTVFLYLMNKKNYDNVVYLDPDLYFVDALKEVDDALLKGAEAVLTPHILEPAENVEVHDVKMLQFGIYNLGFLALRSTPDVEKFLRWWERRLEKDCVIKLEEGIFVDQKWADLLPAFVSGVKILRHPGYNVAYWNLPQRTITFEGDKWYSNTEPLRFVHFSGNNLDDEDVFSRHSQQVTTQNIGDLRGLLKEYRDAVFKQGHQFYRTLPYAFSWTGESGINLHTPEELDRSQLENSNHDSSLLTNDEPVSHDALQDSRRFDARSLIGAINVGVEVSGGVLPFAKKVIGTVRIHGFKYVMNKAKAFQNYPRSVESSGGEFQVEETETCKRLLYMDWAVPMPDKDAASVTAVNLMEIFISLGYEVTFVPCGLKYEEGYVEDLERVGVQVLCYPAIKSLSEWLASHSGMFDICVMARAPVVYEHVKLIREYSPQVKIIFNTVDLHYVRELRQAKINNDKSLEKAALQLKEKELKLMQLSNITILLSKEEQYHVREELPESALTVLPVVFENTGVAGEDYTRRKDILFIGSYPHLPNVDAVVYFVKEIFPIIKKELPDLRFKIVGSNPPKEILEMSSIEGVDVLGFVKDLDPIFKSIKLSIAPLRYGAGIKGKIGTSLCYGVPCVASSIAVEGMGLTADHNVVVGDTPEDFASKLIEIYKNKKMWQQISDRGRSFVKENYSIDAIRLRVENMLWCVNEGWNPIASLYEISCWNEYKLHAKKLQAEYQRRLNVEEALLPNNEESGFITKGFCGVCGRETNYLTSFMYATSNGPSGRLMPNWREHMQCEHCGLVNRVRAGLHALFTVATPKVDSAIYITERVTNTYHWLRQRFPNLHGSEYFGGGYKPGEIVDGVRHEDIMKLSFDDKAFDRILSFDVLEHVPYFENAISEIYRVLADKGVFLFSVPFDRDSENNRTRAEINEAGEIRHILEPEYHGNPVDPENGALCFTHFGWEMLQQLREVGFKNVKALSYWSEVQGYLGGEQFLFYAEK